jgi:hypothetical protein
MMMVSLRMGGDGETEKAGISVTRKDEKKTYPTPTKDTRM